MPFLIGSLILYFPMTHFPKTNISSCKFCEYFCKAEVCSHSGPAMIFRTSIDLWRESEAQFSFTPHNLTVTPMISKQFFSHVASHSSLSHGLSCLGCSPWHLHWTLFAAVDLSASNLTSHDNSTNIIPLNSSRVLDIVRHSWSRNILSHSPASKGSKQP